MSFETFLQLIECFNKIDNGLTLKDGVILKTPITREEWKIIRSEIQIDNIIGNVQTKV